MIPGKMDNALSPPKGLAGITATFGDITKFIDGSGTLSSEWQSREMSYVLLPFQIPLSWATDTLVSRMRCHRLLVPTFESLFRKIVQGGLRGKVTSFGGCFQYRAQRTGTKLSTHSWGIAIDLNTVENEQGTDGDMDPGLVEVFRSEGFKWGGDWEGKSKDPMHFQFCTDY
jgi:D-alanyl-D-alanine carboxypeptidase